MNRLSAIRPVLLVAAPFFLALGLVLPLVRFEKLWFFDETPSLLEIVASLKWSMMDVLLVAIVIAAAKTTGLANAFTQPGLWCYAASAMISGLLHSLEGNVPGPK